MTQNSVGIIGLSALADHLADRGIKVHTGEKVRDAARAVNEAASADATFHILVADHKESATVLLPWLRKMMKSHKVVFVRTPLPAGGHRLDMSVPGDRLEVPFTSDELGRLADLNLPTFSVSANGAISTETQAETFIDDEDGVDFFDEPEPVAAAETEDDSWGQPVSVTKQDKPVAAQADDEDDWGTPAPVQREVQQPEPVIFEDPVFEDDKAEDEAEDDSWGGIPSVPPARPARPEPAAAVAPSFIDERSPEAFSQKKPGDVLFTWAAKGGVGKTSIAMMLAQRAAEKGKKVVLVDGNRGQGDVRKYLRLNTAGLPTAYDVASGAKPASAILHPKILRSNRPDTVDDIDFALVQAPSQGLANASVVNTDVYRQILAACREVAELVVIDTQIAEEDDTTKLHSELWVPAMASYAWNLAIADTSPPGVTNLKERITDHEKDGVPSTRTMSVINNASQTLDYNEQKLGDYLGEKSNFVGFVKREASIESSLTMGNIPTTDPAITHELDAILYRVTGDMLFAPAERTEAEKPVKKGLLGWFRR